MTACRYDSLWCYGDGFDAMSSVSPCEPSYEQYANSPQNHNSGSHDIRHIFLPRSEIPVLVCARGSKVVQIMAWHCTVNELSII